MSDQKGIFRFTNKAADEAELTLYDAIDSWGETNAKSVRDVLKSAGGVKKLRIRINSPGGSIVEGTAIYNMLLRHPATKVVTVDGIAASMASVVAMAGDEIEMGEGAYIMIHDPLSWAAGGADDLRDMADVLDKMKSQIVGIYSKRTGKPEADIAALMADETWMTAQEAIDLGFANRMAPGIKAAARVGIGQFMNPPANLLETPKMSDKTEAKAATIQEIKAACKGADDAFLVAQLTAGATMDQARAAWTDELSGRLEAATKARVDSEAKAAEVEAKAKQDAPSGALGTRASGTKAIDGDPIAQWNTALAALVAQGMLRAKAISKLAREQPELHQAYLSAYNDQHAAARR